MIATSHTHARPIVSLLAGTCLILALAAACGGDDDDSQAQQYFSRSADAVREFVPDSDSVNLRYLATTPATEEAVDLVIATRLEGKPRMHVISDNDAIQDATELAAYKDVRIYQKLDTFWAELPREEGAIQVFAGTPSLDGLQAYLDFYESGEPELTSERFWDAFAFSEEKITEETGEDPYLLVVDYERAFEGDFSGIRVETTSETYEIAVTILFVSGEAGEATDFAEDVVMAFKERFAVAPEALEAVENPFDYPARVWSNVHTRIGGPAATTGAATSSPEATQ